MAVAGRSIVSLLTYLLTGQYAHTQVRTQTEESVAAMEKQTLGHEGRPQTDVSLQGAKIMKIGSYLPKLIVRNKISPLLDKVYTKRKHQSGNELRQSFCNLCIICR